MIKAMFLYLKGKQINFKDLFIFLGRNFKDLNI